jgi:hypothetical protein
MKRATRSKPEVVKVRNIAVRIYLIERDAATGKRVTFEVADYTSVNRRFRAYSDHAKGRREALKIAHQLVSGETSAATMRNTDAANYGRSLEMIGPNQPRKVIAELKIKK